MAISDLIIFGRTNCRQPFSMISRGLLAKLASDASRLSTTQLPTICSGARSLAIFSKPLFSNISSRAQDVSRWDQSKSVRFYAAISTVKQSRATPRTSKGKATKTKATKSKRKTATTKSKGGRKKGAAKKKARGKGAKYSKKAKKIRKARKLTEKQKANAKFKKERAQLRHLKEEALKQPKKLPQTAWTVLLTETTKKGTPLAQSAKEAAQRYRTMSSSEREVSHAMLLWSFGRQICKATYFREGLQLIIQPALQPSRKRERQEERRSPPGLACRTHARGDPPRKQRPSSPSLYTTQPRRQTSPRDAPRSRYQG